MLPLDRRLFFGVSLTGLAAALAAGPMLIGKEVPEEDPNGIRPDTLFLTWGGDPTTTMTIQWVGGHEKTPDPSIHLAEDGEERWRAFQPSFKPFPLSQSILFRCELNGLKPGTEYRFRIGAGSPTFKFRTMPSKATNAIQFVSGGDCGINQHVIANNQLAAKQDPWFAVLGGDLAYDDGRNSAITLEWLRNYSQHMIDSKGRLIPMVVCIGNHEVNGSYNKTRKEAPFFFALFDGLYRETSYATLDFGDYLSLVLMDTGHVSKIAGEQTDWLDKTLKERVEVPHLIVVNHVPAYPSFRAPESPKQGQTGTGEDQRKHWVPLFERHNVDLVLEHHDHTFKRTHPLKGGLKSDTGILYLGDGSWGKLRSAAKAENRPYLAAASTGYHMTLHRLEDAQRFHMAMEDTGRIIDVCSTTKKPRKAK